MNAPSAYSEAVPGGYRAMVRFVHKARHVPLSKGGKPLTFDTHAEARIAGLEAILSHMVSTITGSGERATLARRSAEAVFRKGRKIEVEVRNGKRA